MTRLRQIDFLVVGKTTAAQWLPLFLTRDRDLAIAKARHLKAGYAQHVLQRLKLPAGDVVEVAIVLVIDGQPRRMESIARRDPVETELDAALAAMFAAPAAPRAGTHYAGLDELPEGRE